jgi:uncharacterized protein (TIGR02466 family)
MQEDQFSVNVLEMTNIVHFKNVISEPDRRELITQILSYKSGNPTSENSNPNCWRGDPHLKGAISNDFLELLEDIVSKYRAMYDQTMIKPTVLATAKAEIDRYDRNSPQINAWFNVNGTGGGNVMHTHSGNYLSGTLYLQSTGTGYIELVSENFMYKNMHHCWPYFGSAKYYPEDGDLLLFPSFLAHYVEPNPSLRSRINMAFDIWYEFKTA